MLAWYPRPSTEYFSVPNVDEKPLHHLFASHSDLRVDMFLPIETGVRSRWLSWPFIIFHSVVALLAAAVLSASRKISHIADVNIAPQCLLTVSVMKSRSI